MKDKELQRYYEEQFNMFSSEGWRDFLEDMQNLFEAVDDLDSIENEATLWFRKGQIDVLKLILERKSTFEATWEDLNRQGMI